MIKLFKNERRSLRQMVSQLGLTLTEVGLAVAVSAIIIVVGLSIYKTVMENAKITAYIKELPVIVLAVSSYGTYPIAAHPMDVGYPTNRSPWGTLMDVGYNAFARGRAILVVTLSVPECSRVRKRVLAAMKGFDGVYAECQSYASLGLGDALYVYVPH